MKSVTRADGCYFTGLYIQRILSLVELYGEDFSGWPEIRLRNVTITWAAHMKAARPCDIAHWPIDSVLLRKKNGTHATYWFEADTAEVKWFGTKTCQASFSSPMPLQRVRPEFIPGSKKYDLFLMINAYITMIAGRMPPKSILSKKQSSLHHAGTFLSSRVSQHTGKSRFLGKQCIRTIIADEMLAASIPKRFTPGTIRGNTASTMWFLGSRACIKGLTKNQIKDITCHKHVSTYENHYERAVADEAALALSQYRPKSKLKLFRLEELLCLGVSS
jgi:hypothetical protein